MRDSVLCPVACLSENPPMLMPDFIDLRLKHICAHGTSGSFKKKKFFQWKWKYFAIPQYQFEQATFLGLALLWSERNLFWFDRPMRCWQAQGTQKLCPIPSATSTIRSTYEIPFFFWIFLHPQSKLCPIPSAASTICILCTYPINNLYILPASICSLQNL